jgi:hypothetical protein
MTVNHAVLTVLMAVLSAPAPEPDAVKAPTGPQPQQVLARMDNEGNLEIMTSRLVPEERDVTKTVIVGGVTRAVTEKVTVMVPVQVVHRVLTEGMKMATAGGKEVDAKDVPERLKKWTPLVMSADGKKIDPFYLSVLKENTLTIVVPPSPDKPK